MCMCAPALWWCMNMNMNMTRHAGIHHMYLAGPFRLLLRVLHPRLRRRCHLASRTPPARAPARVRVRFRPHLLTCIRPKGQAKARAGGVDLLERKLPQIPRSLERKLPAPPTVHLAWERQLLPRGPKVAWERPHLQPWGPGGVLSFLVQSGIDRTPPPVLGPQAVFARCRPCLPVTWSLRLRLLRIRRKRVRILPPFHPPGGMMRLQLPSAQGQKRLELTLPPPLPCAGSSSRSASSASPTTWTSTCRVGTTRNS